jgi:hypothetical protein
MSYSTTNYAEIDPILESWASRRGVEWIRDDRGWDIRSLYWPLAHPESVQLWLDEPANGGVAIHVCQNTTRGGQHRRDWQVPVGDLESALDDSLDAALSLWAELKKND